MKSFKLDRSRIITSSCIYNGRLRLESKLKIITTYKNDRKVHGKNSPEVRPDFGLVAELGQSYGRPKVVVVELVGLGESLVG